MVSFSLATSPRRSGHGSPPFGHAPIVTWAARKGSPDAHAALRWSSRCPGRGVGAGASARHPSGGSRRSFGRPRPGRSGPAERPIQRCTGGSATTLRAGPGGQSPELGPAQAVDEDGGGAGRVGRVTADVAVRGPVNGDRDRRSQLAFRSGARIIGSRGRTSRRRSRRRRPRRRTRWSRRWRGCDGNRPSLSTAANWDTLNCVRRIDCAIEQIKSAQDFQCQVAGPFLGLNLEVIWSRI
jgi:hypothetical protein